jgi:hypothetical protein
VLNQQGFEFFRPTIAVEQFKAVGLTLFNDGRAWTRCLLDEPIVRETAVHELRTISRTSVKSGARKSGVELNDALRLF